MIYDAKVETLLRLLERKLEDYGRYDATGQTHKKQSARDQINVLVARITKLNITDLPSYVRVIE